MTRIAFIILLALVGCSNPATISSESNPWVNLSGLRTYRWIQSNEGASTPDLDLKIRAEIDGQLIKNGYRHVDTNTKPDFFVSYKIERTTKEEPMPAANQTNPVIHESSDVLTSTFSTGTLTITMIGSNLRAILWKGTAEWRRSDSLSMDEKKQAAKTVIGRIFADFNQKEN